MYNHTKISIDMRLEGAFPRTSASPILQFNTNIYARGDQFEYDTIIGHMQGTIIPTMWHNKAVDVLQVAGDVSEDLWYLVHSVYDGKSWRFHWELPLEHTLGDRIICFETANIEHQFRGWNIGAVAGAETLDMLNLTSGVAVTKPFPLLDEYAKHIPDDAKQTCQKLAKHWGKVGFVENPLEPEYMYLDGKKSRPQPILDCRIDNPK